MLTDKLTKRQSYKLFTFAVGVFLVLQVIFVALNSLTGMVDDDGNYTGYWFWIVNGILQLSLIAAVAVFCKISKVKYFSAVGLNKKPKLSTLLLSVGLAVGLFCFVYPIQTWVLKLLEELGFSASSSVPVDNDPITFVLLIVVVGLLPAFAEEQLFRGALLGGLKSFGTIKAGLICGALFALFHMNPAQTVHQFIMGFALAYIALRADNLYPSMLVHLFNNIIVIVLAVTLGDAVDLFVEEYWYAFLLVGAAVCAACAYAFIKLTPSNERNVEAEKTSPTASTAGGETTEKQTTGDVLILFSGILACAILWISGFNAG